jgi:hypothetical protein
MVILFGELKGQKVPIEISNGDCDLIRQVVSAVANRDKNALNRLPHVSPPNRVDFWPVLDCYGIEFSAPDANFLNDARIVQFGDGRGLAIEVKLRSCCSKDHFVWLVLELITRAEPHRVLVSHHYLGSVP